MSNAVILIVEDDPFVATNLSRSLSSAGFERIVLLPSTEQTRSFLDTLTPSLAIVDVLLDDGPCVEIAEILATRGVPFLVSSALRRSDVDPIFLSGVWAPKPLAADDLISLVKAALRSNSVSA